MSEKRRARSRSLDDDENDVMLQQTLVSAARSARGLLLVGGADDEALGPREGIVADHPEEAEAAVAPHPARPVSTRVGGGGGRGRRRTSPWARTSPRSRASWLLLPCLRDEARREGGRGERVGEGSQRPARSGGGISRRGDGSLNERTNGTDGPRAPGWTIGRARGGSTRARGSGAGDEARRTRE